MFNFIANYFRNRRREIFRFWDGQKIRRADPVAVWCEILEDPDFEIERDTALMEKNDRSAWKRCVACTRRVLNISDLAAGGLTEDEIVQTFQTFCVFVTTLKKNSSGPPILSEPTDTSRFGQVWPPPNRTPDFSSTPAVPNCDLPASFPMG